MNITVAYSSDENYATLTLVSAVSLLRKHPNDTVTIILLANGFIHAPNPLNILCFPDEKHMFLIASCRDTIVSRLPFAIDELKIFWGGRF